MIHNILKGSHPLHIHANGPSKHFNPWLTIFDNRDLFTIANDCPALSVITYNSNPDSIFENHCRKSGIKVCRPAIINKKYRVSDKSRGLLNFAKTCPTKYILFSDASDAILVGNTQEIVNRFLSLNCRLLFSAEKNHWPDLCPTADFEKQISLAPYCYLNAGGMIGETKYLQEFLWEDIDDQGFWKQEYKKRYPEIKIDSECLIFQTLFGVEPAELEIS